MKSSDSYPGTADSPGGAEPGGNSHKKQWYRDFIASGISDGRPYLNPYHIKIPTFVRSVKGLLNAHIENFCSKSLSYDNDNLGATKGILNS